MIRLQIPTQQPYEVLIGRGFLPDTGSFLRTLFPAPCRIVLVSDDNVHPLYAAPVLAALRAEGYTVFSYSFPAGEASKSLSAYFALLNFLAEQPLTRSDLLVALGGGVTGDLTGFCAATYLRGIPFVQIPTTLLAAVDSSVGGKTGVNLPAGKNLAGAFWQPSLVLCDCDTFDTLSPAVFADGMAEVIKYAMIADHALFQELLTAPVTDLPLLVSRCVALKRDAVIADERDCGQRQLLNFGHTAGHAIEACSHYEISHGHAVGIGMLIMTQIAQLLQLTPADLLSPLRACLKRHHLPVTTTFSAQELAQAVLSDKKRQGGQITLVLPDAIGHCVLHKIPVSHLLPLFARALEVL